MPNVKSAIRLVCIDGHKFVHLNDYEYESLSNSIVQMFEERDRKSLPVKCLMSKSNFKRK